MFLLTDVCNSQQMSPSGSWLILKKNLLGILNMNMLISLALCVMILLSNWLIFLDSEVAVMDGVPCANNTNSKCEYNIWYTYDVATNVMMLIRELNICLF